MELALKHIYSVFLQMRDDKDELAWRPGVYLWTLLCHSMKIPFLKEPILHGTITHFWCSDPCECGYTSKYYIK